MIATLGRGVTKSLDGVADSLLSRGNRGSSDDGSANQSCEDSHDEMFQVGVDQSKQFNSRSQ